MAEQNTEDTKQPSPLRPGVRPFAGPAGNTGAARPFLRPPVPGQRPAPFAPRAIPNRPALGTVAAPVGTSVAPVAPRVEEPAPVSGLMSSAPDAIVVPAERLVPTEPVAPTEAAAAHTSVKPIASEIAALDAIDAFDALWASANEVASESHTVQAPEPSADPTPFDELSLGVADVPSVWSEEIAGAVEHDTSFEADEPPRPASVEMPAWLTDDGAPAPADAPPEPAESAAPEAISASNAITDDPGAAWHNAPHEHRVDEDVVAGEALAAAASLAAVEPPTPESAWRETMRSTELEDLAPAVVAAPEPREEPRASGTDRPRFELVDETERVSAHLSAPSLEAGMPLAAQPGLHVAAALDRLADRIRAGEIDVSSIAPEASDAAMLASVLAALLGGSSSR